MKEDAIKKYRRLEVSFVLVPAVIMFGLWTLYYFLEIDFSKFWFYYAILYLFVIALVLIASKCRHQGDLEMNGLIFAALLFILISSTILYSYQDSAKYRAGTTNAKDITGIDLKSNDIRYKNNPEKEPYTYLSFKFDDGSYTAIQISNYIANYDEPSERPWTKELDDSAYNYLLSDYQSLRQTNNYFIFYVKNATTGEEVGYNTMPQSVGMFTFTYIFFNSSNLTLVYLSYNVYVK